MTVEIGGRMTTEASPGKNGIYTLHRLQKGLADFVLGRAVQSIASFALLVVLIRVLTMSDYGAYMVVQGIVRMMRRLGSFGLLQTAQYFIPKVASDVPVRARYRFVLALVGARVVTLILIAALLSFTWDAIAGALGFSPAQVEATILVAVLVISFQCLVFLTESLEALLDQRLAQVTNALLPIGRLALVGAVWVSQPETFSIESILWIDIVVSSSCAVLAFALLLWRLRGLPGGTASMPSTREAVRFACHFAPVGVLDVFLSAGALRMVVAHVLGLSEAALFAFVQQLADLGARIGPAALLQRLIQPILISRFGGPGGIRLVRDSINILWKLDVILIGAAIVTVGTIGNDLLSLVSSGKFATGIENLVLFLLILVANTQKNLAVMAMQLIGQSARVWKFSLLAPVGLLLASAAASFGLSILVTSVWIISTIWSIVALRSVEAQHAELTLDWTAMFRVAVAAAVGVGLGVTVAQAFSGPLWPVVVACTVAAALYVACLAVLRPLNGPEFDILAQAMGPVLAKPIRVLSRA